MIVHGLSLYLETHDHRLLMDTGSTGAFADNAEALGIDLTRVDTVVLSHGHYDHAGGLLRFAALNPGAPIYLQAGADGDFYHGDRYIGIDDIGANGSPRMGFCLPALQSAQTKFGGRRCSGIVHFGFMHFDIYPDGSVAWVRHILNVRAAVPQVENL